MGAWLCIYGRWVLGRREGGTKNPVALVPCQKITIDYNIEPLGRGELQA